jgi:hypothetical protein
MTKAARAMYPLSSSMERNKNSSAIMGRKVSTPPTPEISPSTSSPLSHPGARTASSHPDTPGHRTSSTNQAMPSDIQAPGPLKVTRNTASIIPRKTGMAQIRWVATASIRSVAVRSPSWLFFFTEERITRSTNRYRLSASRVSRSPRGLADSYSPAMASILSRTAWSSARSLATSPSPPSSLMAAQ